MTSFREFLRENQAQGVSVVYLTSDDILSELKQRLPKPKKEMKRLHDEFGFITREVENEDYNQAIKDVIKALGLEDIK